MKSQMRIEWADMRLASLGLLFGAIGASIFWGPSNAFAANETSSPCDLPPVVEMCQQSCSLNCTDIDFVYDHLELCKKTRDGAPLVEDPRCAGIFNVNVESPSEQRPTEDPRDRRSNDVPNRDYGRNDPASANQSGRFGDQTTSTNPWQRPAVDIGAASEAAREAESQVDEGPRNCEEIADPFERADCEDKFPACASNTPELITRSQNLDTAIRGELENFKDVLSFEPDKIGSRENLCQFSREQLREYYSDARGDSSKITNLQVQANEIEACGKEIEKWVATLIQDTNDDRLQDDLIRQTNEDLKELEPLRLQLSQSIVRLQEAEPKILSVVRLHNRFCASAPSDGRNTGQSGSTRR